VVQGRIFAWHIKSFCFIELFQLFSDLSIGFELKNADPRLLESVGLAVFRVFLWFCLR
jgi:hypothetical protein